MTIKWPGSFETSKSEFGLYFIQTSVLTYFSRFSFQRVVIFISDHSHDDTGDLYIGPDLSAPVAYVIFFFF